MQNQLVDAKTLLKEIFPESCRPSLRWLRDQQAKRAIPFVKLGRFVFFNPDQVLNYLAEKKTAQARRPH